MSYMVMADVMEEEPPHPTKKRSIDSCCGPTKEGPRALAVVRDSRVRMMEECEENYFCQTSKKRREAQSEKAMAIIG